MSEQQIAGLTNVKRIINNAIALFDAGTYSGPNCSVAAEVRSWLSSLQADCDKNLNCLEGSDEQKEAAN